MTYKNLYLVRLTYADTRNAFAVVSSPKERDRVFASLMTWCHVFTLTSLQLGDRIAIMVRSGLCDVSSPINQSTGELPY